MIYLKNVKRYCRDDYTLIKNYEQAVNSPEKWECHHWNEQWFTGDELKKLGRYYNVPHDELVFMTCKEHKQWHSKYGAAEKERCRKIGEFNKGKPLSEETKKKISESNKGRTPTMKGRTSPMKGKKFSEESKKIMREKRRAYWAKKRALKNTTVSGL